MGGTLVTRLERMPISMLHCKIVSLMLNGAISYAMLFVISQLVLPDKVNGSQYDGGPTSQNPSRAQPEAQYTPRPGVPM